MANKPKYKVGQKVKGDGVEGTVLRVWSVAPDVYRYSIKTASGRISLDEVEISKA